MKNNKMLKYGGRLIGRYRQNLANYFVKYIQSYLDEGFKINYITIQNEPDASQSWKSCLYDTNEEIEFILNYLYPSFKENNIATKILIWDYNKHGVFKRALDELSLDEARSIVSGIAYHYYSGDHFENIKLVREHFPEKLIIHTEGCTGFSDVSAEDEYKNGEIYTHDIIGDLNAGTNAYIDWNLLLDNKGDPNHKKNYCKSPIMLTKDGTEYIKTSAYYYIGHFSKYIKVGARKIAFSSYTNNIEITAFENIDKSIVVVVLNRFWYSVDYNICIRDELIKDSIAPNSIVTYVISSKI